MGGGGRGDDFAGGSLRNSGDLLRGGGSGALEGERDNCDDELRWLPGGVVWLLVGILCCRGVEIGELEVSALKYSDGFVFDKLGLDVFGGELGGSTVRKGEYCAAGWGPV